MLIRVAILVIFSVIIGKTISDVNSPESRSTETSDDNDIPDHDEAHENSLSGYDTV